MMSLRKTKKAYGNLYNWYTATASSGTTSVTGGADASASICPKGWKLPPSAGNGSYVNLMQNTSTTSSISTTTHGNSASYIAALQEAPLYFVLSGLYLSEQNDTGVYWSRTSSPSANSSADLYFKKSANSYFNLQNHNTKTFGFAVRCVFTPTMQDFSAVACANLQTAQSITLKDSRDLNEYSVTKQADGNCWMTDNLQLGTTVTKDSSGTPTSASIASSDITLTSADSDVTTDFIIPTSQIQSSGSSAWVDNTNEPSKVSSYQTVHVYSLPANNLSYASAGVNGKSYGNLYNWYTATAGTGLRSTGSTTSGEEASGSICPKGWKLPPNTNNGSYTGLMQNQISSSIPTSGTNTTYTSQFVTAPLSFVLSGYYPGGLSGQDSNGYYWSRTAHSADRAYGLFFYTSDGDYYLRGGSYKYSGFSVRCVFLP